MSESKFLKFQDLDNDGLIDVCDPEIAITEVPCKGPCTPNPAAIVPNWKKRNITEPFLNEKKCLYQVTKVTRYTDTAPGSLLSTGASWEIDAALSKRFDEFKDEVVDSLLTFYEKDDSPESKLKVYENLTYDKFDLAAIPHSRLKLLYSVPFDVIYELPPAAPEADESDDDEVGIVKIKLDAGKMTTDMIRVRKGLNLYGRLLKVYRGIGEGNGYYVADRTIFNLEDYGDDALFGKPGLMLTLMNELEGFLDAKGIRLPGEFFGKFSGSQLATQLEFVFDEYKLKKLRVWTVECGNKPQFFGPKRLEPLNAQSAWKDKTAVAYLAQLPRMAAQFNARVQIPWQELLVQYTYPKIFFDIKEENVEPSIGSCIADALAEEGKELGQDIMDEVFGIGDALAYLFRKNICRNSIDETLEDNLLFGTYPGEKPTDITKAYGMATEQAFLKLAQDDNVFVILCAGVMASTTNFGPAKSALEKLHRFGLQRIKVCGLFDMLMDVLKCLTGGFTLEEALRSLINSALGNMSVELFGVLFQDLPADKRAELEAKVRKAMEEGTGLVGELPKPWESQAVIDSQRANSVEDNHEGTTPAGSYVPANQGQQDRTIVEQYDSGVSEIENMDVDSVMQVYIVAILELYSDNLLELIDELNKFPGAQIVGSIIALLDCPHPPLLNPGFDDFIKSLAFPFCRNMKEFQIDRIVFENPLQYLPDFADITKAIWEAAKEAIMFLVFKIIMLVMVKICELIGDAICKALEVTGDIVAALPAAMAGKTTIKDVIKEGICGPDAEDSKVEDTLVDMMSQLGLGAAAFANKADTVQFGLDLSAATTERELSAALLGNASAQFLEIADQLIEFEYPQFRSALPNRQSIGRIFNNVGNLTPVEYRDKLANYVQQAPESELSPANPSMCASPEQIEKFRELRCEILEGRASPEQCHKMFCDMREDMLDDLDDLGNILQGGLSKHVKKNLPPIVGDPGCDDGIFPYESPQQTAVATQVLKGNLDMLKIDYTTDMLGNGNFWGQDSAWGFMNMVLSDTMGNPLTAHHRKSFNRKSYVDFAANLPNGGEASTGFFSFLQGSTGFSGQHGQFPYYVAEWMRRQFMNAGYSEAMYQSHIIKPGFYTLRGMGEDLMKSMDVDDGKGFSSTNSATDAVNFRIDIEDLATQNLFGPVTSGINLFMIPDFGYNTSVRVDMGAEPDSPALGRRKGQVIITRNVRKGTTSSGPNSQKESGGSSGKAFVKASESGADIALDFRDNAAGTRHPPEHLIGGEREWASTGKKFTKGGSGAPANPPGNDNEWSYGYELHCYYSDIYENEDGEILNRPDDNIRVEIIEKINYGSDHLGPLGMALEDEMNKMEPFDLPDWIEIIPLVGWCFELLINSIALPFTQLLMRNLVRSLRRTKKLVMRIREFEFIAVDDGLDVFNAIPDPVEAKGVDYPKVSDYPNYANSLISLQSHAPQVLLLSDMLGVDINSAKTTYDNSMNTLFKQMCKEIADVKENSARTAFKTGAGGGWLYGADYDFLTSSDYDYGVVKDGKFIPYYATEYAEEDMILGMSRDQFNCIQDPDRDVSDARIIYLSPAVFGGSFTKPAMYVKPLKYTGWMGFVQVFFPDFTPCKPHNQDLVDFDEINSMIQKYFPNMAEDPRLQQDPECVRETPFNRIMNRAAKSGMYSLIIAAIRIYASAHIFKAMGTFSKIMPKFPDNYSSIYSAYIVERMEEDFRDAQGGFAEAFTTFKDDEFWYGFLEQSVECYDFLVENGEITPPPKGGYLQDAFDAINNLQTEYAFPYRQTSERTYTNSEGEEVKQVVLGLFDAKMAGEAGFFQSLKSYRSDENLEAVQSVEEHAKLILQQLVNYELTKMGKRMVDNMRQNGFNPKIFDLDYYIFSELCTGGEDLYFLGPDAVEIIADLPTPGTPHPDGTMWPGPFYTEGGEFRVAQDKDTGNEFEYGDEYVGYYHGHIDDDGDVVYMAGETHITGTHDVLTPIDDLITIGTESFETVRQSIHEDDDISEDIFSTDSDDTESYLAARASQSSPYPQVKMEVKPLGTVADLGEAGLSSDDEKIYALEKYISINGTKYKPSDALSRIKSNNSELRISDVYPGTLELVVADDTGNPIGIKGNIGVRYGLNFYYIKSGKKLITSVEVDSLDLKIGQFSVMRDSSKLLFCLLNKLKDDPKYKLMTSYIFSIKKVNAIMAIYNDFGFLSSIGEVTPGKGDYTEWLPTGKAFAFAADNRASTNNKSHWLGNSQFPQVRVKPGSRAYVHRKTTTKSYDPPASERKHMYPFGLIGDDPIEYDVVTMNPNKSGVTGNEGWAHFDDRQPGFFGGMFVKEWDMWDRKLMRNSKSRIKRLFRTYYFSRDFQPGDDLLGAEDDPAKLWIKNLKAKMFPSPGAAQLPWWQRGRLRSNPYNGKGELCSGKD